MGSGRFDRSDYTMYSQSVTRGVDGSRKSAAQVFTNRRLVDDLNPSRFVTRESRDSELNPLSRAIILALDVTGSMGIIADNMIGESLGTLMGGILDTKPFDDPHLMIMAIGDAAYDGAPLQMSQFEADIRIAQQLQQVYLEGGGGANNTESYDLAWHAAATRTSIDCWEKRGQRGYLFTIGDEMPPVGLKSSQIRNIYGGTEQASYTAKELLDMAKERYDVFHIIVEEGNYARRQVARVCTEWQKLMGKHAIRLSNYKKLPEVILAVILVNEGKDPEEVVAMYPDCEEVIRHALFGPTGQ